MKPHPYRKNSVRPLISCGATARENPLPPTPPLHFFKLILFPSWTSSSLTPSPLSLSLFIIGTGPYSSGVPYWSFFPFLFVIFLALGCPQVV